MRAPMLQGASPRPRAATGQIVAYTADAAVSADEFRRRVAGIARELSGRPQRRWALVCEDTYWFAAGFMALAQAGKTILLPQTAEPASIAEAGAEAILTDEPARMPLPVLLDPQRTGEAEAGNILADDELPLELYTSGSTGRPKRVDKRLGQLRAEVASLESAWGALCGDAVVLASVPHHHLYGLLFRVLWPLWNGRPLYAPSCAQPFALNQALRRFPRAVLVSSPAFLGRIAESAALEPAASLAALFSSGAPLPESAARSLQAQFGLAPLEVYGSTETGGIAWRTWDERGPYPAWQPFTQVELGLPDSDVAPLRMRAAWSWRSDWMETGDLAERAPSGCFLLRGRHDNVVKVEDKRLSLEEMRQRLLNHPWVAEARLVLLPGRRTVVGAVVVLNGTGQASVQADGLRTARMALRENLRAYYGAVLVPRKWRFVDALPADAMGKVVLEDLTALFAERQ